MSPFEKIFGKKPDLKHLRIWGCEGYALVPQERREHKLSDRSRSVILLGYGEHTKGYIVQDKETSQIFFTRSITFNESKVLQERGQVVKNTENQDTVIFQDVHMDKEDTDELPLLDLTGEHHQGELDQRSQFTDEEDQEIDKTRRLLSRLSLSPIVRPNDIQDINTEEIDLNESTDLTDLDELEDNSGVSQDLLEEENRVKNNSYNTDSSFEFFLANQGDEEDQTEITEDNQLHPANDPDAYLKSKRTYKAPYTVAQQYLESKAFPSDFEGGSEQVEGVRRSLRNRSANIAEIIYSLCAIRQEPADIEEAFRDKDAAEWKQAAEDEYNSLIKNKTWELVELPKGRKLLFVNGYSR
jgi:hypothetical protein